MITLYKLEHMVTNLVEDRAQLLEREDAECVGGDGDNALGALQGVDSIEKIVLEFWVEKPIQTLFLF